MPALDSAAVLEQCRRIGDGLTTAGIDNQLIANEFGEPLAVLARGALETDRVVGSLSLRAANVVATDTYPYQTVTQGKILPFSASTVYPASFLHVVDTIVQAARGDDEVLATGFGNQAEEDELSIESYSFGLHIDFPYRPDKYSNENLHGLNVHATRYGAAMLQLGLLRRFTDKQLVVDTPPEDRLELYEQLAAPLTEPLEIVPGDVLIFQAQQHRGRRLLPIAHQLIPITPERLFDVFTPKVAPARKVLAARQRVARQYQLQAVGY